MCRGIVRVEFYGSLQVGKCFVELPLSGQSGPQDCDCIDRAGVLFHDLAALGNRFTSIAAGQQLIGQAETRFQHGGGQSNGLAPLGDGLLVTAGGSKRNRQASMSPRAGWVGTHRFFVMRNGLVSFPLRSQTLSKRAWASSITYKSIEPIAKVSRRWVIASSVFPCLLNRKAR